MCVFVHGFKFYGVRIWSDGQLCMFSSQTVSKVEFDNIREYMPPTFQRYQSSQFHLTTKRSNNKRNNFQHMIKDISVKIVITHSNADFKFLPGRMLA